MVQREDSLEQAVPQRKSSRMRNGIALQSVLLSSCYLAPITYYALLYNAENATIEICDHYQKQSYRNRCNIAGANGILSLSIPVEKTSGNRSIMRDIRIADHGNWQHLHWNAIVSAYRSTPFFQYYEDEFRPYYEKRFTFLHDFNEGLRQLINCLIDIETTVSYTSTYITAPPSSMIDYRELIHPKRSSPCQIPHYYKVFANKNGLTPDLSIIDLLFNMGNETRLILRKIKKDSFTMDHES